MTRERSDDERRSEAPGHEAIAWALVRNLESDADTLTFRDFTLRYLRQGVADDLWTKGRKLFPNRVRWGDWLYERRYARIPAMPGDPTGFGRIPYDVEDSLFLLRLFHVGDIVFAAHALEDKEGETFQQMPYRVFFDISTRHSYRIEQRDCAGFDQFANEIGPRVAYKQTPEEPWLEVAKRFFLYGGGKEVNPHYSILDRILDYVICLEACLLVESDFVGRHVRERAAALVGDHTAVKLVRDYYEVRSKIAHGVALDQGTKRTLDRLQEFETLVRRVLVEAVRRVPRSEVDRETFLRQLFSMSANDMASNFYERIRGLGAECEELIRRRLVHGERGGPEID